MDKRNRVLLSLVLVVATAAKAQTLTSPGTHGLRLTIKESAASKDPRESKSQRSSLKSCLDRHPSFACKPLTVTLKNEGDETILHRFSSCPGGILDASFEIQNRDGSWRSFTPGDGFHCVSNVSGVKRIGPGDSVDFPLTLADLNLPLDQPEPFAIRVRWDISGCIAAQRDAPVDPFAGERLCLGDKETQPRFVSLQSNELRFEGESIRNGGR